MRLLLVPHAPTAWNAQDRFQGWADTPLNETGKNQAALVAERLRHEPIDCCFSSNLSRARATAEAIGLTTGLACTAEPRLRELNFGGWEGLTYAEIRAVDSQALSNWEADPLHVAPPGGETLAELAARLTAFSADLRNQVQATQTALLVAHRGSLRVLLCLSLGLPASAWWQFNLKPVSVTEMYVYPVGAVLGYLNDTHHLRDAAHAR